LFKHKKIIEVHGCFWHQHKGCIDSHIPNTRQSYWRPKLAANCQRDKTNLRRLKRLGWRVLRIWECDVTNAQRLDRRIRKFLEG
jgi:DNA mismatch endonuclease (patch repair protein)